MTFRNSSARLVVPDDTPAPEALARTTHLAIGAHQDDLEIMAFEGILACYQQPDAWYCGVVVTNGSGSPRAGVYANYTDDEMCAVRAQEQIKAAHVGEFGAQILLDYPSSAIKDGADKQPVEDLADIIKAANAHTIYTHNLADKHDTHIGVTLKVIEAIRSVPEDVRPKRLLGCEVWRDLDWLLDDEKVAMDCSAHENLQAALVGVFDSQIAGGKRYDLATLGRRRAHATYAASHATDETTGLTYAMDLTPLVTDTSLDPAAFTQAHIDRFRDDVAARIARAQ
jgi:LmbE family N-acetylglucosaminyl deacetylase